MVCPHALLAPTRAVPYLLELFRLAALSAPEFSAGRHASPEAQRELQEAVALKKPDLKDVISLITNIT